MDRYIISNDGVLEVIDLCDLHPSTTVIAEVVKDDEDPLVILKNPYASIYDFWWPENMFIGPKRRLSSLQFPV